MKHFAIFVAFVAFAVASPAVAQELPTRPAPKGIGKFAAPISSAVGAGKTEGQAFWETLSPEMQKKLKEEGQSLWGEQKKQDKSGSYAGYIKAIAIFKQPKARVWELMVVPTMQPKYLPRLTNAKTVDKPDYGELVEFKLKVAFSKFVFYTRHWFYPEYSRVEWALDPKKESDIAVQEGYWQLYALDANTTIGEYGTKVDTGVAVPQFIQDYLAKKDIPTALTAFRAYMDSDGKYRRDD